MNTLAYLQFFDGLAEKQRGSFILEKVSSKCCEPKSSGDLHTYHCNFSTEQFDFKSDGNSRKEALRQLYRKMNHFGGF
ncbi:MAG: hypothetical protein COB67_01415 [SAR324 cluster bacterium]|uniref:Uncharacterized protein n=1 Tax=SAR324 cluster bacterium TaxID=2024889 RepID=A0A2A4TAI1_9DELT|nr:MAG: hypothetical protein COB67_01415 [SAR324 cluster bacterium]